MDPGAGEVVGEDPVYHGGGDGVGFEAVQASAVGGLGGVGVRPGVGEAVAVGRASAEVAAFDLGLGGHGGADADLDALAFGLAHAAEHRHDHVVGFGLGVDRAADLGDPHLHAVVHEHRMRQAELVAVERALRLADHDGVEPAVRVLERFQQRCGARAPLPREGAGVGDVEVLGDDHAADGFDEGLRAVQLPVP
ncbi:hypothetical protein LO772_27450 [Yinghuangia sp. ASG 101]|nr:hypothetical protein [Yinghuangia sp. ASG 101]UGQ10551.1 hypothetical protein LO772_27450 [Yinghuangia sp. ASG 101]